MKNLLLAALFSCAFLCASTADAQRPPRPTVALVDLEYLFKNHVGFTAMKADLKTEIAVAEQDVKGRRERINQMIKQLKELPKGTPQYKEVENTLTKDHAELNVKLAVGQRKFVEKEAQMLYSVYQEVIEEVARWCRHNGVRLAIRYSGQPLEIENHKQVLKALQRQVLFADPTIDITKIILAQLNRKHSVHANRPGGPRR